MLCRDCSPIRQVSKYNMLAHIKHRQLFVNLTMRTIKNGEHTISDTDHAMLYKAFPINKSHMLKLLERDMI